MRWDAVEREFYVIGVQLEKLSRSFMALAAELAREREKGNREGYKPYEGRESPAKTDKTGPPPGVLAFQRREHGEDHT